MDLEEKEIFDKLYKLTKGKILEFARLKAQEYINQYKGIETPTEEVHEKVLKSLDNLIQDIKSNEIIMKMLSQITGSLGGLDHDGNTGIAFGASISGSAYIDRLVNYPPFLEKIDKIKKDFSDTINAIYNNKQKMDGEDKEEERGVGLDVDDDADEEEGDDDKKKTKRKRRTKKEMEEARRKEEEEKRKREEERKRGN